jgi:hypothetical protein
MPGAPGAWGWGGGLETLWVQSRGLGAAKERDHVDTMAETGSLVGGPPMQFQHSCRNTPRVVSSSP